MPVQNQDMRSIRADAVEARRSEYFSRWCVHILRLCILGIASYGLLYFAYRFNRPWPGSNDYYDNYYFMYLSPLDLNASPAPYVLRQLSAIATHLVLITHLYVPDREAIAVPGRDPRVLFAAMLTNWIFLLLAAWLAGLIAEEELGQRNAVVALAAGFLCLLAFQTPFFVISGLTEGVSWFLLAAGFLAYLRRASRWLLLVMMLSIVQRESIFIVLGVIAACDLMIEREDRRFKVQTLVGAVVCFGVYFLIRRLGVHGSEHQTHITAMLTSLRHLPSAKVFASQMVLTQSTAILFFAAAFAGRHGTHLKRVWVPCLLAAIIAMDCVGVAAGIVSNMSRVLAILVPILAGFTAVGLWRQRQRFE